MILYNTTYNISRRVEQDWIRWMKTVQIPGMMATKLPVEHKMMRLLTEIDTDGATYTCQYLFRTMEDYLAYQTEHQAAFDQKLRDRFEDRYVLFRTLLEEV